jgi:hypothetical protein
MNFKLVFRSWALLSLLLIAAGSSWATTYNPAADFESGWTSGSNPNGVWSYGYSSSPTGSVALYNEQSAGIVNGPNEQSWYYNPDFAPSLAYNNGPAYNNGNGYGNVNFLANEFDLVAGIGIGGLCSDLVFTAPATGIYDIVGGFRGDQYGIDTYVAVLGGGSTLFNSTVTAEGQVVPFSTDVSLTPGETIVFSAGPLSGVTNTGLDVTIMSNGSPVPEPSSLLLLSAGLAGLGGIIRRKLHA